MNIMTFFKKYFYYGSRKIHLYIGLFLVLFIWLFSYSGLLLNHWNWRISEFWEQREEFNTESKIVLPETRNSFELIKKITSQLDIRGEISNIKMWEDSIYFRVSIPGHIRNVNVYFNDERCMQNEIKFNLAGIIRTMHLFNGMDRYDPNSKPNWLISKIWRISMDGIALGLILICVTSWIMWFKVRNNFPWSFMVFLIGLGIAFYFIFFLVKI